MQLERTSSLTGVKHFRNVPVTLREIKDWEQSGKHIQDYFPDLSDDDREFILTGITPEEWQMAFGEDEEEELDLPTHFDEILRQAEENGQSVEIRLEKE